MADNVGYTPGTGATVAADEIGGVLHQRIKLTLGADGVSDGDVSSSNPLPVSVGGVIDISGTITDGTPSAGQMLLVGGQTAGGVAQVFETNGSGHLHISDGGGSITVDGPLTDSQLRASPVPVSADSLPLPAGSATDATLSALSSIQEEIKSLNDTMLVLLNAIFEKMPRVTGNDQAAVTIEGGTVTTVTAVTTVATVSSVTAMTTLTNQQQFGTKFVSGDNFNLAGCLHIYDNIKVS